jgi:hypothetical protein
MSNGETMERFKCLVGLVYCNVGAAPDGESASGFRYPPSFSTSHRSHTRPVVYVDLPLQRSAVALLASDTIVISAVTATHEWRITLDRHDYSILADAILRLAPRRQ